MFSAALVSIVVLLSSSSSPFAPRADRSDIRSDETVIFFPTCGARSGADAAWQLHIHGWIFEKEDRSVGMAVLRRLFADERAKDAAAARIFEQRTWMFFVDNERGKRIVIRLGKQTYTLDESGPDGHFSGRVRLPGKTAEALLVDDKGADGCLRFEAVLPKGDSRVFSGQVQLLEPTGVSVISDIDDTIKISQVRDKPELLRNTFLREFKAVPGMADVYRAWSARIQARFHYVSASPWQLYPALDDLRRAAGYPPGSFHLKYFRMKDETILNLFKSSEDYKRGVIEELFRRFPARRFVLVGDSGEKDPEVYADLARRFPQRVERILIRNVTDDSAAAERYRATFRDLPAELWRVFDEPAEIREAVRR